MESRLKTRYALRFLALAVAAVVLGVISAAVSFGQFGPEFREMGFSASSSNETPVNSRFTDSETLSALRHIMGK